ncbi:MAG: MerR family transcriptional regulator [Bacillus sp. (in: firmicutes)]
MDLLRKKDLHPVVGVAKSTVADWIEDFNVYIPKTKHGNVTYYKPETIDVLLFIKQCREQNYHKQQIMEMLSEKGFPITVDEAVEDVKKALEGNNSRDTLLTVMQTMGQAVTKLAEQDELMDKLDGQVKEQAESIKTVEEKQNRQDERLNEIEKRTDELELLKQQIEDLKSELVAAKEKKGLWSRLFGK